MSAALAGMLRGIAPLRERVARWWDGLSGRERLLVAIFGAVAALALTMSAVVKPIRAARAEALTTIRVHDGLQSGLRGAVAGGAPTQRGGDPVAILSGSAGQFGITLAQAVPDGDGARAEVGARFEALLRWIAEVERSSALRIASADVRPAGTTGLVTARLVFAR